MNFILRSVGQATKDKYVKPGKAIFSTSISIYVGCSFYIFLIISNSFATYRCRHPCFNYYLYCKNNLIVKQHLNKKTSIVFIPMKLTF